MFEKLRKFFANANQGKGNGTGKKILLAEDSAVDRKFVVKTLEKQGYQVRAVDNGEACLEVVANEKFDLAILDCDMPKINGLEVCRRLKKDDQTQQIPVIFLTSDDTPRNIFDCYEMDAENYLKKPISAQSLLNEIEAVIKTNSPVD